MTDVQPQLKPSGQRDRVMTAVVQPSGYSDLEWTDLPGSDLEIAVVIPGPSGWDVRLNQNGFAIPGGVVTLVRHK